MSLKSIECMSISVRNRIQNLTVPTSKLQKAMKSNNGFVTAKLIHFGKISNSTLATNLESTVLQIRNRL